MASNDTSTYVEWMWQSNLNPYSPYEEEEWCSYSEEECEIIEEAYARGASRAQLNNYYIDFDSSKQVSIKDNNKRRPVKRVVHNKESWIKYEGKLGEGYFGKIIEDSKTYYSDSSRGAIRWLAPELCFDRSERCSFSSDVWAFGCVLLEMMTKKVPWRKIYEDNQELINALADERNG
ncbi:unnamed protein product, partial [Rotaria sordida]